MDEEFYNHLSIYSKVQNSQSTPHLFMFGQENGNLLKRANMHENALYNAKT